MYSSSAGFMDDDDNVPALVWEDWLYVGSLASSRNVSYLKKRGITHVYSLIGIEPYKDDDLVYSSVDVADVPNQDLDAALNHGLAYLYVRKRNAEKVLVHCYAGISRSVTLVMAYLIMECGMDYGTALVRVRQTRRDALPNVGFEEQLRKLVLLRDQGASVVPSTSASHQAYSN
jgi:hypothetical protein